jgi:hypothetical protein
MPNPYVVRVDRDAFWNQFRSTPEPALMMRRPPVLVEEPLFRDRWPSTGPYAGQSFPPFGYSNEEREVPPIMQPLPEGMLPTAPSDVQIEGLDAVSAVSAGLWSVLGAGLSGYHGYMRNGESPEWAAIWAVSSLMVTSFVSPMLWIAIPAFGFSQGYAKRTFHRTALFTND